MSAIVQRDMRLPEKRMRWMSFITIVLLSAAGCDKTCADLADLEPSIEIGTGWQGFEPISDTTGFERGAQNGFHIYGSVRATGLHGGSGLLINKKTPVLTYTLKAIDGGLTGGFSEFQRQMKTLPDGTIERIGDLVILNTFDAAGAEGVDVDLFVEIQDTCGRSASATATTTLSEGAF